MNKKTVIFGIAVFLMVGTAVALNHLRANQRLGAPGVKTSPSDDPKRSRVDLPPVVLNYTSEELPTDKIVLDFLPKDTSFGQRRYKAPDGNWLLMNVVLMGADRTSIHKPQFCLAGSGWDIDAEVSTQESIRIDRPVPYDLPVMKLVTTKKGVLDGKTITARGVYVYWFVADGAYTAQHWQRMLWMAGNVLRTGVLQRWAYVSCFAICYPGQEEATFQRMKQFIAASVPEFQLTPRAQDKLASAPSN